MSKKEKELDPQIIAKYKRDLVEAYEEANGQRAAVLFCMKEMLDRQDQLIGLCLKIEDFLYRIDQYFLDDIPPKKKEANDE